MRITKPKPIAFLARPRTIAGRSDLCIAGILAFRLDAPRTLVDELGFWATSQSVLGNVPVDEAYPKPTGEFLLAGSCFAPGGQAVRSSFARVRLGTLDKSVSVSGDRHWRGTGLPTEPLPFVAMPLDWAHAFGGAGFDGNPSGKGAAVIDAAGERANPLPNVERIAALVANPSDRPPPESFLPMDVTMPARRKLAGTYDAEWQQRFAPGFPADVAPAFFNNGREDQRLAAGFFRGDETFILENVHPKRSRIESQLPGLTVRALVALGGAGPDALVDVPLRCDTVWFFPSAELGAVIFHGAVPIREQDGHDVTDVVLACEDLDHRLDLAHYMEALRRRQDRDTGAVAQLAESDLLPRSVVVGGAEVDAEMGAWTRSERLQQERTERGRTRRRGEAAEQLRAAGLDPTAYGLGEESGTIELPPTNPDDLPAFLERSRRALEQSSEDAARQALEAKSAADAAPDAPGAAEEPIGGPPRFRAQDAAKEFRAELAEARDAGAPNPDLEALAGTPEFEAELLRREQALRELYLTTAHLAPDALPMTSEATAMAKLVVAMARETNEPLAGRDFTGADLRGMDLRGMDFTGAFLEAADLRGADLSGANFEGAVLAKADLRGATLQSTRLQKANLGGANLEGADLEEACLRDAIVARARTENARFRHANFEGADLLEVDWQGVDLRGATFERCTFLKANLSGTTFAGARLVQTTFLECTLDGTMFDGANLHKASVIACKGARASFAGVDAHEAVFVHTSDLPEANFEGANLERCCMRTTGLRGARFGRANLTMSDLSECDVTGGSFEQAVMKGALAVRINLERASLRGVNGSEALLTSARIAGADFTGSQLTRADFTGAIGDDRTRFTEAVVRWTRFNAREGKA